MQVPFEDYDVSVMVNAIKEIKVLLDTKQYATFTELDKEICDRLNKYESFKDGFERLHLTLTKDVVDSNDFKQSVRDMNAKCENKLKDYECSQKDQVNDILPFVRSSSKILVHGSGSLLALTVACAIQYYEGVHFYICEGRPGSEATPDGSGAALIKRVLETPEGMRLKDKIQKYCTIIPDSGVGSVMSSMDFVIMGANCVTEHGGLVHSTGSLQIAMIAQFRKVPLYVLCETFKFAHVFPLSTEDLKQPGNGKNVVPLVEFVPPSMITLIFSDQGIMPPSAVADEMFRFHTAPFAPWKRS